MELKNFHSCLEARDSVEKFLFASWSTGLKERNSRFPLESWNWLLVGHWHMDGSFLILATNTLNQYGCLLGCSSSNFPLSSPGGLSSVSFLEPSVEQMSLGIKILDCCSWGSSRLSGSSPPPLAPANQEAPQVSRHQAAPGHPDQIYHF